MIASQIFRKEPFFHGHDNTDQVCGISKQQSASSLTRTRQLVKIVKVLGTDLLFSYLAHYHLELPSEYEGKFTFEPSYRHACMLNRSYSTRIPVKPWASFITAENQHLATPEALDLIDKTIRFVHSVCRCDFLFNLIRF